ncbi:MAG: error-prone DNA polymerase [Pseudomonadota bacterium]
MLPAYAELHAVSNFTVLRGASHPEELVERARALGYAALALTDECSLAGIVRAHVAAKAAGLKLIAGAEVRLTDGPKLVLLAPDRKAYARLCALITRGRRAARKGRYRLARRDLEEEAAAGCLALWIPGEEPGIEEARWVKERFEDRAFLAVELHAGPGDRARLGRLGELGRKAGLGLVAAGDVHMHARSRKPLQDLLTAIRLGVPVAEAGYALLPNAERRLRCRAELARRYPAPLLARTVEIASRCAFSLDELRYEYPEELVPAGESPASHLRRLVEAGLARRYPAGAPQKARALVERELALIAELGYEAYFLTVHDIVAFARSRGILCQGRGSAANSAVCYALGITEVDPARQEVLFERFVSRERREPPDIDVDFEHERREEVIQYIYRKYGRERAALAATVITYQPRSAVRDAARALGLAPDQVDRLAKSLGPWDGWEAAPRRLREAGLDPKAPLARRLVKLVGELVGFPRHLSQHVGGFVISRGPLCELVPIENAAMPERTVVQWDKDDLDALGMLKVDCLALGMLTAIRKALAFISHGAGKPMTLAGIPPEDPETYAMIRRADTVGVFQIESRAQMAMLPKTRPASFYDLVVQVAIVRPGPIQGGMVNPYLRRRQGLEPVAYPGPELEAVLARTLGVPLFQEQILRLASLAAGFTPGEAERLRRAMGAGRRPGALEAFERRFLEGMLARGYGEEAARRLWEQIEGFGGYGFPESHAASFALLAYASAWLKRHHPAAFAAALLNAQPMGFYAPAQLVQDARRHGVEARPVDVAVSDWDCTLEPAAGAAQPALRLGLRLVKGLPRAAAERIVAARCKRPFEDVADLARRAALGRGELARLAEADALASLAGHRRSALWASLGVGPATPLMPETGVEEAAPALAAPAEGEEIAADYGSLGLTLRRHPLALLRGRLARRGYATAQALEGLAHGRPSRVAGLVTHRQRPETASGVVFVTLEDETGHANVVVWSSIAERDRPALLSARLLGVEGVIEREGEVVHLVARRLVDLSRLLGQLIVRSRDFR